MDWIRGENVGHGSFATVNLAVPRSKSGGVFPLMAVKSCGFSQSSSLMKEKLILDELKDCPEVVRCFGESFSYENGEKLYNVLLEYAPGGTLADKLKNYSDRRLPESEVRRCTKALLRGIHYIHKLGYVHCDIKLQNILLGSNGGVKIADFGLAKKAEGGVSACELRGTPLYMSPEMVYSGEQGPPADIWAVGCVVAEMATGSPAWRCSDVPGLLFRIGIGEEVPEIPGNLSAEGKDFVRRCFVKNPSNRWTAEMLLNHPFIADDQDFDDDVDVVSLTTKEEQSASISPRCPLDFPDWASSTCSTTSLPLPVYSSEYGSSFSGDLWSISPSVHLRDLVNNQILLDWSVSDDWLTVR
ncbi:mitogen-activated protein kinase kinase kinase 20-like [Primulina eburnea]|uniref:mitogen-activated protein kinase kinase kinase 20-like n=1 Tax=Primulina eburnea TaxID=1245227 RepID=UPI003C6C8506